VKIVSIVGAQDSGKTVLVERLVRHFARAGLRVGTVKHAHGGFDVPGSDSHRHFRAGADVTVLVGPEAAATFRRGAPGFPRRELRGMDVVLVEGFSRLPMRRIEVVGRGPRRRVKADAIVSASALGARVPVFRPREIARIARFILERP